MIGPLNNITSASFGGEKGNVFQLVNTLHEIFQLPPTFFQDGFLTDEVKNDCVILFKFTENRSVRDFQRNFVFTMAYENINRLQVS